jgi:hypothetical protein
MVDYTTFSALRHLFPREVLESARWYSEVSPDGSNFDMEYLGGLWDTEMIDGVTLWFPKSDGNKVAIVDVSAGRYVDSIPEEGKPAPDRGPDPAHVANVNRALEALGLPRMGDSEAAVRSLAAGRVWSHLKPDAVAPGTVTIPHGDPRLRGTARSTLFFATRAPDVYHVAATVHVAQGLLRLEIRRPDLVQRNFLEDDFTYDMGLRMQYEGWPGGGGDQAW